MAKTMTSVLHQHPKRTMTQEIADARQGDETMTEVQHRLAGGPSTPVTPPVPNNTTFVSATVITNANPNASGTGVIVTLSDNKGYESDTAEWQVKINGTVKPLAGVEGHNTTTFTLGFNQAGAIKKGDVVLVSHLVAAHGIVKFLDKPVTNSLT